MAHAQVTYIHEDFQGSVAAESNSAGQIIKRVHYEPFGEQRPTQLSNETAYTGHVYDADIGLTYMGARYYDPVIGRFYSDDPVAFSFKDPTTFNRYSYVSNNPYKYVDPDGKRKALIKFLQNLFSGKKKGGRDSKKGAGQQVGDKVDQSKANIKKVDKVDDKKTGNQPSGQTSGNIDENKLRHLFGKPQHKLDDLVKTYGSEKEAFLALQRATQEAVKKQKIKGIFETTVKVGGETVKVRGNVVNGVVKIGTAFK